MNTPPPYKPQQVIDPLFVNKSESAILNELIDRELAETGFDVKNDSLAHFEKKKMNATLISAPINLILIVLFRVFHYSNAGLVLLIGINFYIWLKFQKSDVKTFFVAEIMRRQDEKFSDVIAPHLYDKCKNQKWWRVLILAGCTFILPVLMFMSQHVMYEDAPDGKYIRFYTEGLLGNNILEIPDEIGGTPVKGIRGDVFKNTGLVAVTLPNSIDTLRGHAFENCSDLKKVNLPQNLKYIGGYAFSGCNNLFDVKFPKSLTYIGGHAFEGCAILQASELPQSLKYIGGYAFQNCKSIAIKELPQQMDSIGAHAFHGCFGIKDITLPENIEVIHEGCFQGTGIHKLVIPASLKRIGAYAFSYTYVNELRFEEGSQLERIGAHAFHDTELTEVVLPPTVKEIRSSAFRDSKKLKRAVVPEGCEVDPKAFKGSPAKVEYYSPTKQ